MLTSTKRQIMVRLLVVVAVVLSAKSVGAHEVRPAYIEISETAPGSWDVLWKQPVVGNVAVKLVPHISTGWLERPPAEMQSNGSFLVAHWRNLPGPVGVLDGQTLRVEGLDRTITDVFVTVESSRSTHHALLTPAKPDMGLGVYGGRLSYLTMGIVHILTGPDHLMFVLGLMLLVKSRSALLAAVTAFTVAHSITLAATAFRIMRVPSATIEALVALSVMFLAVEVVLDWRGQPGVSARQPWVVAFAFGLLHGCAFASALTELGLPRPEIPFALVLFNLGVELGQLLFIAIVLSTLWAWRRVHLPMSGRWLAPYAIGSSAAFWFIERLVAIAQ
jgi:hydrogenase/urease accessory protein HupE